MATIRTDNDLTPAITRLLEQHIAETTEAVVQKAVKEFEDKLRREIATTSMQVAQFYELSSDRNNLVIKVKLPESK